MIFKFIFLIVIINIIRNATKKAELEACATLADNFKSGLIKGGFSWGKKLQSCEHFLAQAHSLAYLVVQIWQSQQQIWGQKYDQTRPDQFSRVYTFLLQTFLECAQILIYVAMKYGHILNTCDFWLEW